MPGRLDLVEGAWEPGDFVAGPAADWLGLFVVEGALLRRVRAGGGSSCEVLGPGDLLRPCDSDRDYEPLPITVDWHVLTPAVCEILDDRFAAGSLRGRS